MPILALADDFTGAAEIAGIGLRYGLAVRLIRGGIEGDAVSADGSVGLMVIDSDSRHLRPADAARRVRGILAGIASRPFEQVYKKTDSVLRGPVLAEIRATMDAFRRPRALLLPQNPSRQRIIRRGEYIIGGELLHLTSFARDPEYPRTTSSVVELLHPHSGEAVQHLRLGRPLPTIGIAVGDGSWPEHLESWADELDPTVLPAGGADFFEAVLRRQCQRPAPVEDEPLTAPARTAPADTATKSKRLLVCGSASPTNRRSIELARLNQWPLWEMPAALVQSSDAASRTTWVDQVCDSLEHVGRAMVAVDQAVVPNRAAHVRAEMAALVDATLRRCDLSDLYVEGGATAAAVAERMRWRRFRVEAEIAPGIVRLRPEASGGPSLTLKPGSYEWPACTWSPGASFTPNSAA